MKFRLFILIGALTLPATIRSNAQNAPAAVAGTVSLPKLKIHRGAKSRYQIRTTRVAPLQLPRAVVYLEGDFPAPSPGKTVELEQKNFQFNPALFPIQTGTTVTFPNRDDEYHNVLSYSRAKEFDLGRYLKSENPPAILFDRPGLVELNCEIHAHMVSYVLILETPYFTTTDDKGNFRLEGLPAGNYRLTAWIDRKTQWHQSVRLTAGKTLQTRFAPSR